MCIFLLAILGAQFATAKTNQKQESSFEYYLNLHQEARQQLPPVPHYKIPEIQIEPVVTEITPEDLEVEDDTAPVDTEPTVSTETVIELPITAAIPESKEPSPEEVSDLPQTTSTQIPTLETKPIGMIAIIIDDIGYHEALDERVARLPGAVTLAVLPHTPHSKRVAQIAYELNKDVMLHAPMESENNRRLGDGALTQNLSKEEFEAILQESINAIPHVIGVNNHMGSLLTQNNEAMTWVMNIVKKNNLFFVDSRTSPDSIAGELAKQYNIPTISRHVFLDNEQSDEYVDEAFQKTLNISRKTGFALAIGHPYPSTVSYLEEALPKLAEQGYQLVPVSYVLSQKMQTAQAHQQTNSMAKK